jgi:hypothetical protein
MLTPGDFGALVFTWCRIKFFFVNQERDLTPEEVDKLVQLQDITGIDDLQICRALLESNRC